MRIVSIYGADNASLAKDFLEYYQLDDCSILLNETLQDDLVDNVESAFHPDIIILPSTAKLRSSSLIERLGDTHERSSAGNIVIRRPNLDVNVGIKAPSYILLPTSGTMSTQKYCAVEKQSLENSVDSIISRMGIESKKPHVLLCLPFSYILGLSTLMLSKRIGCPCDVLPTIFEMIKFIGERKARGVRYIISIVSSQLSILDRLLASSDVTEDCTLSISVAGGAINYKVLEILQARYKNLELFVGYGSTELGSRFFFERSDAFVAAMGSWHINNIPGNKYPICKLLPHQSDFKSESGEPVYELCGDTSRGFRNYAASRSEIERGLQKVNWFNTGDLFTRSGQDIKFIGRVGDTRKISGRRVSMAQLTSLLQTIVPHLYVIFRENRLEIYLLSGERSAEVEKIKTRLDQLRIKSSDYSFFDICTLPLTSRGKLRHG